MPEDWRNLRTYAVIREPYSWLTSYYNFLNDQEEKGKTDRPVAGVSFEEFVNATAEEKLGGPKTPWFKVGSQSDRVCHPKKGKLIVNKLLCFDFLSDEFNRFQVRHFDSKELKLERLNATKRPKVEINEELRSFVEEHWANDLSLWKRAYEQAERKQQRRLENQAKKKSIKSAA